MKPKILHVMDVYLLSDLLYSVEVGQNDLEIWSQITGG